MKTINESWKEFEAKVIPPGSSPIQHREMKRAYFAGFDVAIGALLVTADVLEEAEACKRLDRYRQEIRGFAEAIKLGKA